ncbi:hypothetical protein PPL_05674 [Heterostelium album PN500]|uniref:Uncharacterized protein n=1 Tax=Heterostelium pallidum (strain ATCC 26659 / Pp 5 / PN500) TaxID=670386 RepID=D3BAU3_HETP5|nr:hypothetical protein PPL_05674 [Heterostelium album PN500]EFA81680.1 hypothetical protein PPL_05674 [Heterostelium album PN500]|eukprot:XP_020433797.1 hypothetical protein PPL_05674 [Heterostelium album PN500]
MSKIKSISKVPPQSTTNKRSSSPNNGNNEKLTVVHFNLKFGGSGEMMCERNSRFWKPTKDDLNFLLLDSQEKRTPDLSTIYLQSFTILKYDNQFNLPISLNFSGLPQSNNPNISHQVILSSKTTNDSLNLNLVAGSLEKQEENNTQTTPIQCPIPLPKITIDNEHNSLITFPNELLGFKDNINKPKTICGCERIGDFDYSCMHMKNDLEKKYHLFNPFQFMATVQRLDEKPFARGKNQSEISIDIEMKFYFLHYFETQKTTTSRSRYKK